MGKKICEKRKSEKKANHSQFTDVMCVYNRTVHITSLLMPQER